MSSSKRDAFIEGKLAGLREAFFFAKDVLESEWGPEAEDAANEIMRRIEQKADQIERRL